MLFSKKIVIFHSAMQCDAMRWDEMRWNETNNQMKITILFEHHWKTQRNIANPIQKTLKHQRKIANFFERTLNKSRHIVILIQRKMAKGSPGKFFNNSLLAFHSKKKKKKLTKGHPWGALGQISSSLNRNLIKDYSRNCLGSSWPHDLLT